MVIRARRSNATIEVTVSCFREDEKTIKVTKNSTVEDVLEEANISATNGSDVRVNGVEVELQDIVEEGDIIYVVPKVQGGK